MSRIVEGARYLAGSVLPVVAGLGLLAYALHTSGLDMRVADAFYDPALGRFPWRDIIWLEVVGHHLLKLAPALACGAALLVALGSYVVPSWRRWRANAWALTAALLLGPALVTWLKSVTVAHCPWDLSRFGGYADFAQDYAGPWLAPSPAQAGRCLPSGHAGAGFALLSLSFAGAAAGSARWRRWGAIVGAVAGTVFGMVRIVQGAHFPSHVLWSAAACWLVAGVVYLPLLASRKGCASSLFSIAISKLQCVAFKKSRARSATTKLITPLSSGEQPLKASCARAEGPNLLTNTPTNSSMKDWVASTSVKSSVTS